MRRRVPGVPDVLEHVEDLGRQVGALHIKLGQVRLQQGGRGLLGLQGGGLLTDTQDPARTHTRART